MELHPIIWVIIGMFATFGAALAWATWYTHR